MPNEIYVFHPGVGQKKSGEPGPIVVTRGGTNFVYVEQVFSANLTTTADFHGAVVPPNLAPAGNATFRLVLRQVTAGVGMSVEFEVLYGLLTHPEVPPPYVPAPPVRDIPLISIASIVVPIPGAVGLEVAVPFTVPVASFMSGQEVLLSVRRVIGGGDTFVGGAVALERLDMDFPIDAPSPLYNNATPIYDAHGGVELGETFLNQTMQQMFDKILYPYQYPAFSSFSIFGQSNPLEVGDVIPAPVTFIWGTTNPLNITPNSLAIRDLTNAIDLLTGLADDGSEPYSFGAPIQKITAASHAFRVRGQNTKLQIFQRDITYNWYWRVFAGTNVNPSLIEAEIEALSDYTNITPTFARTYSFAAGGYKYVCYPSSYGWATTWTDTLTGFNVPFQNVGTVLVMNTFGQPIGGLSYNVQRSSNIIGAAINIAVS